jgi:hypothetical protein
MTSNISVDIHHSGGLPWVSIVNDIEMKAKTKLGEAGRS